MQEAYQDGRPTHVTVLNHRDKILSRAAKELIREKGSSRARSVAIPSRRRTGATSSNICLQDCLLLPIWLAAGRPWRKAGNSRELRCWMRAV
jgi:hypothetical protein